MESKKVMLNKKTADEIETMCRSGLTIAEISTNLLLPRVYISAILAAREVPLNPRKRKPKIKLVDLNVPVARLNSKEEEFLEIIIKYPDLNLFATERDKTIAFERLGLSQDKVMTYEEIRTLHGITRERVRQIIDSSIKRAKTAVVRHQAKKAIQQANSQALSEFAYKVENEYRTIVAGDMGIEYLDLSVRAYNALVRNNIRTISDLCSKTKMEISKIKNIGINTVLEIISKLGQHGFSFLAD